MEKVISTPDIESIKTYLHSFLNTHERITTADVFQNLKDKLSVQYDENVFRVQLSKAIKDGKMGELTIIRGPHGGIKFAKPNVVLAEKSLEAIKPVVEKVKEEVSSEIQDETDNEENYQQVARELAAKPYFTSPTVPVKKPEPPPVIRHTLILNGTSYLVPHTINEIKTLINKVFEAKEDEAGALEFDKVKYACTEEQAAFLDRFLFFFYGAAIVI